MIQVTVEVRNPSGLHARPGALLVRAARTFASRILVRYGTKTANAKSIVDVLSLGVGYGATIVLEADGPDAPEAIQSLRQLFASETDDPHFT